MKMKEKWPIFLGLAALFAAVSCISFLITLGHYAGEKPIAEVELIKICQKDMHNCGYTPGREFANVKILKVYDPEKFRHTAILISGDGQKANVKFLTNVEVGKVYKVYDRNSLRGPGLASWWSGFGNNLKITFNGIGIGLLFLCMGMLIWIVVKVKQEG